MGCSSAGRPILFSEADLLPPSPPLLHPGLPPGKHGPRRGRGAALTYSHPPPILFPVRPATVATVAAGTAIVAVTATAYRLSLLAYSLPPRLLSTLLTPPSP